MRRILIVEENEIRSDSRADLLRDLNYNVTTTTGQPVPGQFDSVLYVADDLNVAKRENLQKIRAAYPQAKIVVYSSELGIQTLAQQIEMTGAETLLWIRTPEEIAAKLR